MTERPSNPYAELIERLRVEAAEQKLDYGSSVRLLAQAAEAISQLTRDVEELREVLSDLLQSCDRGPPAIHDGCGTTIISAPHPDAMRAAYATLTRLSREEK